MIINEVKTPTLLYSYNRSRPTNILIIINYFVPSRNFTSSTNLYQEKQQQEQKSSTGDQFGKAQDDHYERPTNNTAIYQPIKLKKQPSSRFSYVVENPQYSADISRNKCSSATPTSPQSSVAINASNPTWIPQRKILGARKAIVTEEVDKASQESMTGSELGGVEDVDTMPILQEPQYSLG